MNSWEYFEEFVAEFRRLAQIFELPEPDGYLPSLDENISGIEDGKPGPLTVQIATGQDPAKNARHVFGHYLVDLGQNEEYGDRVADIIGGLLPR